MTNIVDNLRDSRNSYSEKLRQLIINYQKSPTALFCVYEGEDAKYYGIRIDNLTRYEDRRKVPCKGKKDVLRLYNLVSQDDVLRNSKTIFFVDHDFDGLCGHEANGKIYITPCYSVENLYIRDAVVKQILIEEFGVNDFNSSEELNKLLELYRKMLSDCSEALTTLNAWIALQRERENPEAKLHLNSKNLNSFIRISLGIVEKKYTTETLKEFFPKAITISEEEINQKEDDYKLKNKFDLFRGKYYIDFLMTFLNLLIVDRKSDNPRCFLEKKSKVKLHLSRDNILSELSHYAETPICLKNFLLNINSFS